VRGGVRVRRMAALAVALMAGGVAQAADTQWWTLDSASDYARAESRGVVVGSDGTLSLGPRASVWTTDSLGVVWAVQPLPDGSVALAGDRGQIARWTAKDGIRPWVRLRAGQVLSLAADRGGLVAGTGPDGAVWRVSAHGDTTRIARTGERYVWGLAPARGGAWWAATGTHGRLLRIENGRVRVAFDSDESNLVSLTPDGHGGVYAGGDSKGRVYHALAGGAVRTLFDAEEDEVRALAVGADGALYAAAVGTAAITGADDDKDDDGAAGPSPVRAAPAQGGRAAVYRIVPDSAVAVWWTSPQPFVFALAGGAAGLFAATGNRAGVYRIERVNGASQWLAAPQGQVTALALSADHTLWAATSNPAALWRLGPGTAERGSLEPGALDARRIARFGRLGWNGTGEATFTTRSGNVDPPDTTWSAWQPLRDGAIASPPARYLQWRAELAGATTRVDAVETAWREVNLPPRVDDVVVAPQGQGFREGEIVPRAEPVTQTLPGGQKVEYSMPTASQPRPLRELPVWVRGLRAVQWRASDPNGDPLHYRVEVHAEGRGAWIKVVDDLEQPGYVWDTTALPDGRYRVRVTASDVAGNAVGEERTDQAISQPFTIDNTPPAVSELTATSHAGAVELTGTAEDAGSGLARIEVSLDDGEWRAVVPEGGLAGGARQRFAARLPAAAGEHTVSARVVDRAGNAAPRAVHVTVTK
jgi:hypothetical protein